MKIRSALIATALVLSVAGGVKASPYYTPHQGDHGGSGRVDPEFGRGGGRGSTDYRCRGVAYDPSCDRGGGKRAPDDSFGGGGGRKPKVICNGIVANYDPACNLGAGRHSPDDGPSGDWKNYYRRR